MKTIFSKLEDNIFSGILVRKGKNKISDKDYNTLLLNVNFVTFTGLGHIKVESAKFEKVKEAVKETTKTVSKPFEEMTYPELVAYIKANKIDTPSLKKADILTALKGE